MKDLEETLITIGKISSMTMCSVEEVAEAFAKLSEALANERKVSLAGASGKFRTKSEEVEIDWIS